jgi:hypothetical protein
VPTCEYVLFCRTLEASLPPRPAITRKGWQWTRPLPASDRSSAAASSWRYSVVVYSTRSCVTAGSSRRTASGRLSTHWQASWAMPSGASCWKLRR